MRALKESVINLINIENITSSGISNKKKNYYAMILCNSKELTESHIGASSFRISNMHFKKVKPLSRIIDFYGNIENGYETRYITGRIIDLNSHEVFIKDGTVLRIGVPIEENGIYNRESISNQEYINFLKKSNQAWKVGGGRGRKFR